MTKSIARMGGVLLGPKAKEKGEGDSKRWVGRTTK